MSWYLRAAYKYDHAFEIGAKLIALEPQIGAATLQVSRDMATVDAAWSYASERQANEAAALLRAATGLSTMVFTLDEG